MSFLDRSVPLKYAILGAVAVAVFASMSVHGLHSRSDSIARYGPALPAEVVKVDEPKTVGSIFGLWGTTYTNTEVKVTPRSGEPWYYDDIQLGGRAVVGQKLKTWFYNGNPDRANFSNWFDTGSQESYGTPWPSVENKLFLAFFWTFLATLVTFIILRLLSRKKRGRPARPRQKSVAM